MSKNQKAVNIYISVLSASELTFDLSLWIFDFFINSNYLHLSIFMLNKKKSKMHQNFLSIMQRLKIIYYCEDNLIAQLLFFSCI